MLPGILIVTTTTVNAYGQNFPSGTVMGNFVLIFIAVFIIPNVLVAIFGRGQIQGDVVVSLWLFGAFLGGLLGSFASTQAQLGSYGIVPWGFTFFLAVALVVWLIKGGGH